MKKTAVKILGLLVALMAPGFAFAGQGFNALWTSLGGQATGLAQFLVLGMGVAGGFAVAFGLFKAWKASDDNARVEPKQILVPLIVGGLMLAFSVVVNMSSESVGGGTRTAAPAAQNLAF